MIRAVCEELDIPVIAPLARLVDKDGEPQKELVQRDGIHLNVEGTKIYLEEITSLTGTDMRFSSRDRLFEPESEVESFCSLLLDELRVPRSAALAHVDFVKSLSEFIQVSSEIGDWILTVNGETELVDSGLLDSLGLVETYTFAAELLRMDIPFDANLRELNTPSKISEFLLSKKRESRRKSGGRRPVANTTSLFPCVEILTTPNRRAGSEKPTSGYLQWMMSCFVHSRSTSPSYPMAQVSVTASSFSGQH